VNYHISDKFINREMVSKEVILTTAILNRFGVGRKAKYRALQSLKNAGLISVHQVPRRNPVVKILLETDPSLTGQVRCEKVERDAAAAAAASYLLDVPPEPQIAL
jgi:hypothetical protein